MDLDGADCPEHLFGSADRAGGGSGRSGYERGTVRGDADGFYGRGGVPVVRGWEAFGEKRGHGAAVEAALPILGRIFPDSREDGLLRGYLCGNICANLLGLGNAATPMGIQAAKRLKTPGSDAASDQLCRLVVLNTASIQLLPTNVAAVRAALGCGRPFDILPAVWVTSILSAGLGVCAAMLLGRIRKA